MECTLQLQPEIVVCVVFSSELDSHTTRKGAPYLSRALCYLFAVGKDDVSDLTIDVHGGEQNIRPLRKEKTQALFRVLSFPTSTKLPVVNVARTIQQVQTRDLFILPESGYLMPYESVIEVKNSKVIRDRIFGFLPEFHQFRSGQPIFNRQGEYVGVTDFILQDQRVAFPHFRGLRMKQPVLRPDGY